MIKKPQPNYPSKEEAVEITSPWEDVVGDHISLVDSVEGKIEQKTCITIIQTIVQFIPQCIRTSITRKFLSCNFSMDQLDLYFFGGDDLSFDTYLS